MFFINSDLDACKLKRQADGVYLTYTPPGGADPVSKKLGSGVIDLGTGRSFDIKARHNGYQNLTVNNFVVEISSFSAGTSSPGSLGSANNIWPSGYYTLTKSYNQQTGILTAYGTVDGGAGSSSGGSARATATKDAHAYLVEF